MKKIICKSPTRVDLAGGTLNLWPLYNFVNGAHTINVAIDIWTTCEMTARADGRVRINSPDLNQTWEFKNFADFLTRAGADLNFYRCLFSAFQNEFLQSESGFDLLTSSQSPIGGGLGGSSSLVISVLKAFHLFFKLELPPAVELVHLAHNIEAEMLRTPTGTQDYFPAVTGGLSLINYAAHGMKQKVLSLKGTPLMDHFLLVYTGRSHHSGLNNFEVLKSSVQGDPKVLGALQKIKSIAEELKTVIEDRAWTRIPELFQEEFKARVQLTPAFTSPEIEKLNVLCQKAGAAAVKICGAGGGGCVLVWVEPSKRQAVIDVCHREKFECLPAQPIEPLII